MDNDTRLSVIHVSENSATVDDRICRHSSFAVFLKRNRRGVLNVRRETSCIQGTFALPILLSLSVSTLALGGGAFSGGDRAVGPRGSGLGPGFHRRRWESDRGPVSFRVCGWRFQDDGEGLGTGLRLRNGLDSRTADDDRSDQYRDVSLDNVSGNGACSNALDDVADLVPSATTMLHHFGNLMANNAVPKKSTKRFRLTLAMN